MRRLTIWILLLSATLAVGFLLPTVLLTIRDVQQERNVRVYAASDGAIVRNKSWTFEQRLGNAAVSMSPLETSHSSVLDEKDAEVAARSILRQMEEVGFMETDTQWKTEEMKYYLIVSRENAVISDMDQMNGYYAWLCKFSASTGAQIGLLVDDDTGKLLASGFSASDADNAPWAAQKADMSTALCFAAFCEESYGVSLQTIRRRQSDNGNRIRFEYLFSNGTDDELVLFLEAVQGAFKYQAMIPFL